MNGKSGSPAKLNFELLVHDFLPKKKQKTMPSDNDQS